MKISEAVGMVVLFGALAAASVKGDDKSLPAPEPQSSSVSAASYGPAPAPAPMQERR